MIRYYFAVVALVGLLVAPQARAQFNPGPNPITGTVTAAQTIATGTGTIANGGSLQVSGTSVAISINGTAAIVNNGTINQTGIGRALRNNTNNVAVSITNNLGALIQSADADAFQMNTANSSVTFDNYGTVTSLNASKGGAQAIDWNAITTASNTLNNYSTGILQARDADAVRPGVNGVINNYGRIIATKTTDLSDDGIDAQNNSGVSLSNYSTGLVEGARHGITGGALNNTVNFTMSVTNQLGGVIQGDDGSGMNIDGFNAREVVTINNSGTITGNGVTGDGDGVDVDGLVNLTNSGTIRSLNSFSAAPGGASEGVTVGGGTIINSGTIEGDVMAGNVNAVGRGITLGGIDTSGTPEPIYGNSVVANSGLIRGQTDSGIAVLGAASGFTVTINNLAGGTIEGGGATAAAIQTGADNDTVNNAGTIKADASGRAIDLGAGNDTLNITGGNAAIIGDISGGAGTNSLTVDPGSGKAFAYAGSISNFASAEIKSGTVTLSGVSTYSGNTTLSGGALVAANASGSATGSGNVIIQNGATLAGNGRIGGDVILQSGGTISPGLSPGTLSLDSNLTIMNGSKFLFELTSNSTTSDHVAIAGALNFAGVGSAIVNIANNGLVVGNDYSLIFFTSNNGLTLANLTFGDVPSGFAGSFAITNNAVTLHVSAVPDSGSTIVLLAGVCGLLAVAVRRRWENTGSA